MVGKVLLWLYVAGAAAHMALALWYAVPMGLWAGWEYVAGQLVLAPFWPLITLYLAYLLMF